MDLAGFGGDSPDALVAALVRSGLTVASAESITGGRVAAALTAVPGSSAAFVGGVVSYATEVKIDVLGVPASVIAEHGVVSAACAGAMASGVRRLLGTDWAVATTGVAGPGPQEGVPAGTVWVGVAGPSGVDAALLRIDGDRATVQATATRRAVELVAREVLGLR
jgi:nicotinamide-nucleotide amidase